jgi:hypothetical protein
VLEINSIALGVLVAERPLPEFIVRELTHKGSVHRRDSSKKKYAASTSDNVNPQRKIDQWLSIPLFSPLTSATPSRLRRSARRFADHVNAGN